MKTEYPVAYAAYNTDIRIRLQSTSGGIFTAIAEFLIDTYNAIVYGAVFSDTFHVEHCRIDAKEDLGRLRGSKYPQSAIADSYKNVLQDLERDRYVFFVGTPCQIVGLKNYLARDYSKLLCMDFVCHGVASPKVWEAYVGELSKKGEIDSIVFKHKVHGWKKWYFRVQYKNGRIWHRRGYMTKFMNSYLGYVNIRPSCYECRFKGLGHVSDFTISDCWGIAEQDKTINDDRGLSALLLQNERAVEIFEHIRNKLTFKQYDADLLMKGNWTAFKPIPKNAVREDFFRAVAADGPSYALTWYFKPSLRRWINYYIQRIKGTEK